MRPVLLFLIVASCAVSVGAQSMGGNGADLWWFWPLMLFVVTLFIGIVAVLGGVGGAVLFVPIVSGFFPFHLDFVRSAGLIVALSSSLAAGPGFLKKGLASIRLSIPIALVTSVGSIIGALVGLRLPTDIVQTALGVSILLIVVLMVSAKKSEYPVVTESDSTSKMLGWSGCYREASTDSLIAWKTRRTPLALVIFLFIGVMAGMFGLGAGWANVPTLNLLMGLPLKMAAATSSFLLSVTDTSAAWVYINSGAVLPILIAPSVIGIFIGARIGGALMVKASPKAVRIVVIIMLLLAGVRSVLKGLGI